MTGEPISAEVTVYGTRNVAAGGECPRHGQPADRRQADADGTFELSVDGKYATFVAVYCAPGYVAREQLENDNRDGSRVAPDPVRLWPDAARLQAEGLTQPDALQQAIRRVLDRTSESLRAQAQEDPQRFVAALRTLLPIDVEIVAALVGRLPRVRSGPGERLPGPEAARQMMSVLNGVTMDLRYFAAATGAAYFPAIKGIRGVDYQLVEALRNRPLARPLVVPAGSQPPSRNR